MLFLKYPKVIKTIKINYKLLKIKLYIDNISFRCILMSYVEGKTLFDIQLDKLDENETKNLFSQIGKQLGVMDRIMGM